MVGVPRRPWERQKLWPAGEYTPGTDLLHLVVLGYARLGKGLYLFVLREPYEGEVHVQDVVQQLTEAVHLLDDPQRVVLNVAQVPL